MTTLLAPPPLQTEPAGGGRRPSPRRPGPRPQALLAVALVLVAGLVLTMGAVLVLLTSAVALDDEATGPPATGIDTGAIPLAAAELLPELQRILATSCPELPAPWLIALVQTESSWNPRALSPVGAAGLVQMMPASWREAGGGGGSWPGDGRPRDDHPVWQPVPHLEVAVPWMCANLRSMARHLADHPGKQVTPLQALAVCHVSGCSRVVRSATGIPAPGEVGCAAACSRTVHTYVERIERLAASYSASPTSVVGGLPPAPVAYTGGATGCRIDDPTTGGCITGATAHLLAQVPAALGEPWPWGITCWDAHAWNPRSDHPLGRGCDFFVGRAGRFPSTADAEVGWVLADWLRAYAGPLRIRYVIWQGRIWQASRAERGWAPYTGGGVYDAGDATGGHYDHLHVSVEL